MKRIVPPFLLAFLLAPSASAHVFVTSPGPDQIVVATPNDEGATIVGVALVLPKGLKIQQLEQKPGWTTTADGWRDGRVTPGRLATFAAAVEGRGTFQVVVRERLANGRTKTFADTVAIGPQRLRATDRGARTLGRWALAVAAAAAALALGAGALALSSWLRGGTPREG